MTEQEKQADIALLEELIAGEHAAIVQYMIHRFSIGENEVGFEVEEVARREMIHWKWLNERIVKLGGEPVIRRGKMDIGGPSAVDMMKKNVELEEHCIQEYTEAIQKTSNPVLKRQFELHLADELRHKNTFEHLVEEAQELEESDEPKHVPTEQEQHIIQELNKNLSHEYGAVLQYLHQSHSTKDLEMSHSLMNAAFDEMKHMALLADEVEELGGTPYMEPAPVVKGDSDVERLKANIDDEANARIMYQEQIESFINSGREDLAGMMDFIRDQETFHLRDFEDLLEERLESTEDKATQEKIKHLKLTVGSLLSQEQDTK